MRKLIASEFITIDGLFEGLNHELDWFVSQDDTHQFADEMFQNIDTILLGKKTYELFTDYWPPLTPEQDPVAGYINPIPKIVFSKTLDKADWGKWNNITIISNNIEDEIKKLKQQPGKDLILFGSGSIASAFTQAGLIDEYRILLNPVILGAGNAMFKNVTRKLKLKLFDSKIYNSGLVVLYYQADKN